MTTAEAENILKIEDDFGLCDGFFCAAADLTGNKIDWDAEPEPLRTVSLIWATHGIVGNGGFSYLLEHDYGGHKGFLLAASAYERIGAPDPYKAFGMLFDCFPGREIPRDHDKRFELYNQCGEEQRDIIDSTFYRLSDEELERLVARFIRANRSQISIQLQK